MLNVKQINTNICKQINSERLPKNKSDLKKLIRKLIHKELDGCFTSVKEIFEHFGINTKLKEFKYGKIIGENIIKDLMKDKVCDNKILIDKQNIKSKLLKNENF